MSDNLVGLDNPIISLWWDEDQHNAYIELLTYYEQGSSYDSCCWDAPNGEPRRSNVPYADSMKTPIMSWLDEHYRLPDDYTWKWGGPSEFANVNIDGTL